MDNKKQVVIVGAGSDEIMIESIRAAIREASPMDIHVVSLDDVMSSSEPGHIGEYTISTFDLAGPCTPTPRKVQTDAFEKHAMKRYEPKIELDDNMSGASESFRHIAGKQRKSKKIK